MSTTEISPSPVITDEFRWNYWQNYYSQEQVERAEAIRETHSIVSTDVNIHIDVYPQSNPLEAPTIVFNHGSMVYGRMFTHLALDVHELGYNVIMADQRGQGLSGGKQGDYTVPDCVQNILDVCAWAKARYPQTMFISGGSIGGAYSYYAAAAGAEVNAISVVNLMNFGDPKDSIAISRFAWQTHVPGLPQWNQILFPALKNVIGGIRLPINLIGKFEAVLAKGEEEREFREIWAKDPNCARWVSYRYVASNFNNPPATPFEQNTIPILVMNQGNDRMISPEVTRRNYDALGGEKRYWVLEGFEHWSNHPDFWRIIVEESHAWFQQHL